MTSSGVKTVNVIGNEDLFRYIAGAGGGGEQYEGVAVDLKPGASIMVNSTDRVIIRDDDSLYYCDPRTTSTFNQYFSGTTWNNILKTSQAQVNGLSDQLVQIWNLVQNQWYQISTGSIIAGPIKVIRNMTDRILKIVNIIWTNMPSNYGYIHLNREEKAQATSLQPQDTYALLGYQMSISNQGVVYCGDDPYITKFITLFEGDFDAALRYYGSHNAILPQTHETLIGNVEDEVCPIDAQAEGKF